MSPRGNGKPVYSRLTAGSRCKSALTHMISDRTGFPPEKCQEFLDDIGTILGNAFKAGEQIEIPRLGTFGMDLQTAPDPDTQEIDHHFLPSPEFVEVLNGPIIPRRKLTRIPRRRRLFDVDRIAMARFFATRRGDPGTTEISRAIYHPLAVKRYWSDAMCDSCYALLARFAEFVAAPIIYIGFSGAPTDPQQIDTVLTESKNIVVSFGQHYEALTLPKIRERYTEAELQGIRYGDVVWRTGSWIRFLKAATLFYDWLEAAGIRPLGTNPFATVIIHPPLPSHRRSQIMVRQWFRDILAYPKADPREHALAWLLGHGLRAGEISRLQLHHINEDCSIITVLGKGGKKRMVFLNPSGQTALHRWLIFRSNNTWPGVFSNPQTGTPIHADHIYAIIAQLVRRVFFRPEQQHIRDSIHPHAFRRYFVTELRHQGVRDQVIMNQSGHSSPHLLDTYTVLDPEDIKAELAKAWAIYPPTPLGP